MDALEHTAHGEDLTPLGSHLAQLPVEVGIGMLILLGGFFGVVDASLTIAETLSNRSPFIAPFDKRDAADAAKRSFTVGQSDWLACYSAYRHFDELPGSAKYEFARNHFLGIKTLQTIGQLKRHCWGCYLTLGSCPLG